jgi:hypothetical protein
MGGRVRGVGCVGLGAEIVRETPVWKPDKGTIPESLVAVAANAVVTHHKVRAGQLDPGLRYL